MATLPLAEAIRVGARLVEGVVGAYFGFANKPGTIGGCALGGALVADGFVVEDTGYSLYTACERAPLEVKLRWPIESAITAGCPVTECAFTRETGNTLTGIVAHLNDSHSWSPNRIADWVEQKMADYTLELQPRCAVVDIIQEETTHV